MYGIWAKLSERLADFCHVWSDCQDCFDAISQRSQIEDMMSRKNPALFCVVSQFQNPALVNPHQTKHSCSHSLPCPISWHCCMSNTTNVGHTGVGHKPHITLHSGLPAKFGICKSVYACVDKPSDWFYALIWATGRAVGLKSWVFVCSWWQFDWSFARLIAPVVTTTSVVLSTNKIQNGDIPVPANPGSPGEMAVKMERESE